VFNASRVMKLVESDPTGLGAFDTIEWPFDDGINGTIPDVYEYAYYECHEDTTSTMSFFEATKEASLKCMQARLGESDALDVHATLALSHELSALACASPSRCGDAKCDCVTAAEFAEAEPAAGTVVASMVCEYATENITCITTTIDNAANALACPSDAIDLTHNCSSVPEDEVFALATTNLSVCVNLTKSGGFLLVPEVESIACPPNSTLGSLDWVA
jgi:hypothetical protein